MALVASASPRHAAGASAASARPSASASADEAAYTVQPGDTLWAISEHFYGTGEEFPRLVDANAGHRMPDGQTFTRSGVIQPGWVLRVPLPSTALQTQGDQTYYVVEKGDTLRGIAARLLGDENRWPAIFDLNRGKARLADGRVLANPDLIWPGLRLRLPTTEPNAHPNPPSSPAPPVGSRATPEPDRRTPPPPTPPPPAPTVHPAAPTVQAIATISRPPPPPRPTPAAVVARPTPSAASAPETSTAIYGAAGVTLAVGVGAVVARRRFRRSLDDPADETTPPPLTLCNDFAEAELARGLAHRLRSGEVEPVEAIATQTLRFLRERDVGASLLLAHQVRGTTSLLLATGLRDEAEVDELAEDLGRRLGGQALATLTADRDVLLKLTGLTLATLVPPSAAPADDPIWLIPLGLTSAREMLSANWRELGHVLVAGQPAGGVDVVLTSLLAALAACCRPDELRLRTIARRRGLAPALSALPHQDLVVDPDDTTLVADALQDVRAELLRRMARREDGDIPWRPTAGEPALVVTIDEFAAVVDDGTTLELLGTHGPAHGIQLLAGTTRGRDVAEDLLVHFGTRVILQALDDEQSVRLLGRPAAADLGGAEFFLRVEGRVPVRVRGFRVPDAHLHELLRLIDEAYIGSRAARVSPRDETSPEGVLDESPSGVTESADDEAKEAGATPVATADMGDTRRASEGDNPGAPERPDFPVQKTFDDLDAVVDKLVVSVAGPGGEAAASSARRPDGNGVATGPATPVPLELVSPALEGVTALNGSGEYAPAKTNGAVLTMETADLSASDAPATRGALVEIRCLGGFIVTGGNRELSPASDRRNSYKEWELLAFMAALPEGAVPKDQLLAALWPTSPLENAIQSFYTTSSRLRSLLREQVPGLNGKIVVLGRDGICRLDSTQVASDAQRFAALCRAGTKLKADRAKAALSQARRLYRGDLLAGQQYRWPDEDYTGYVPRQYYRDVYKQATRRLAKLLCDDGQTARAVPLYKDLLKTEPTLEDVVRDLFRCYVQLGDLGSLIREERELRQALRGGDSSGEDCEPEKATADLYRRLRSELEAGVRGEPVKAAITPNGR